MIMALAAQDAAAGTWLHSRLQESGLKAQRPVASAAELDRALGEGRVDLVVAGLAWPEASPFLAVGVRHAVPTALVVDEPAVPGTHPAFAHGAAAVLSLTTPTEPLRHALAAVAHGFTVLPGGTRGAPAVQHEPPLSPRERAVLECVAAGLETKRIARRLAMSPHTVKQHLAASFRKLGVRTRAEAIRAALRRGELSL
jgi:two-component system response regulator DesR